MPVVPAGELGDVVPVLDVVLELERLQTGVRAHRAAVLATTPVGGVRRSDRALWALVPDDLEDEDGEDGDDDGEA